MEKLIFLISYIHLKKQTQTKKQRALGKPKVIGVGNPGGGGKPLKISIYLFFSNLQNNLNSRGYDFPFLFFAA